jgi:hypothetical protein
MARRRNNRRISRNGKSSKSAQKLVHPFTQVASAAASTAVPASTVGVISSRPARPVAITLTYMSAVARSFIFTVLAGNGEEVYRSPTILSGPIPETRTFNLPRSTDYAFYATAENVVTFLHATSPSINWVVNMHFEYNNTQPGTFF